MKNNLIIGKSDEKLEDYKENLEINKINNCDVLFITEEYNKYNTHITLKNLFFMFLEEEHNEKINIAEFKKNIDKITSYNSVFFNITEFIVKDIALPLIMGLFVNFISSKMKNNDTINFTITIERMNKDNIKIQYNGKIKDLKSILKETDNFNKILNNKKEQ